MFLKEKACPVLMFPGTLRFINIKLVVLGMCEWSSNSDYIQLCEKANSQNFLSLLCKLNRAAILAPESCNTKPLVINSKITGE
jgi:hypothetical protein